MKKILAVIMAVLMLFSCLAMGVGALTYEGYTLQDDEVLVFLCFGSCTSLSPVKYTDFNIARTGDMESASKTEFNVTGTVGVIVECPGYLTLPTFSTPEGYQPDGWLESGTNIVYGATNVLHFDDADAGRMITYTAKYSQSDVGPSTLDTIKGILVKVFGIIIGLFMGDTDQGMELVESLFASLLG